MANIIIRPDWYLSEKHVTPEAAYRNRRAFIKTLGLGAASAAAMSLTGCDDKPAEVATTPPPPLSPDDFRKYPYQRNPEFDSGWKLSNQEDVFSYNNYYEFTTSKTRVKDLVDDFTIDPWSIEVSGLVDNPTKISLEDVYSNYDLEERVYRFRCVEAWGMIVPWTGFSLSKILEQAAPKSEAKFVKFVTASKPEEMPNWQRLQTQGYPLPYTEGLTVEEAMHPLTMVTTGVYGRELPKQNGAPVRIVVPWKYGYKSIKSIVKIELTTEQPKTLWETLNPVEYPFESNVEPAVAHPRWSQATERMIDSGDRVPTQHLNGYEKEVGHLYKKG